LPNPTVGVEDNTPLQAVRRFVIGAILNELSRNSNRQDLQDYTGFTGFLLKGTLKNMVFVKGASE